VNGYTGAVQVKASVWFQQVPPRWNDEMLGHHGPRIDPFRDMYLAADNTPELVRADSMMVLGTGVSADAPRHGQAGPWAFPNPTRDGIVLIALPQATQVIAYDAAGKRVPVKAARCRPGCTTWYCPPRRGNAWYACCGPRHEAHNFCFHRYPVSAFIFLAEQHIWRHLGWKKRCSPRWHFVTFRTPWSLKFPKP
jgi:hypothetical protein